MGKLMRAIGLMSGTSLDGIDVAFLETDGEDIVLRGPAMTYPYDDVVRRVLVNAIADAQGVKSRDDRPGSLADAETALTERHAVAVTQFIKDASIDRSSIDVIGFHGQTVLHKPDVGITVQLGLGELLANFTRCPVVYDLRAADVEAGGQGAPLVPAYHRALTAKLPQRPIAIVNVGGVANVTWIGRDGNLIAFDTGPGNALIDDWMARKVGTPLDSGGAAASRGPGRRGNGPLISEPRLLCGNAAEIPRPQYVFYRSRRSPLRRRRSSNSGGLHCSRDRQSEGAHARRTRALGDIRRGATEPHDHANAGRTGPPRRRAGRSRRPRWR